MKKSTVFSLVPGFAQAVKFSIKTVKGKELLHTTHGLILCFCNNSRPLHLLFLFF